MIRMALFACLLFAFPNRLTAQLLHATSVQNIINNYKGKADIVDVVRDAEGNIYTLAYVDSGKIGAIRVTYKDGPHYLIKTGKDGDARIVAVINSNIWVASLGIDKRGDILIGGGFSHEMEVNGERLAYTNTGAFGGNDETHAFLLKLDKTGEVVWFRDYPCSNGASVSNILSDEDGNIYVHMMYDGKLMLDDNIIERDGYRNYCIVKMSPRSNTLWYYTISANTTDYLPPVMKLYKPKPDCPQQLLIAWMMPDTPIFSLYTNILYEFSPDGKNVRNYSFFTAGWRGISAIETIGDKIYVAGNFIDTEVIGGVTLYSRAGGVYLAQLNEMLEPQSVKMVMQSRPYGFASVNSLKYIDGYGLIMACVFGDTFTTDAGSYHSAPYSYTPGINTVARGSVLFSFRQDMSISDMQYIDGEDCVVKDFFPADDELELPVWHSGYNPITGSTYDNGYTICRTRMKKQDNWEMYKGEKNQDYVAYPMPFLNTCYVRFDMPVYGYTYHIRNLLGQRIKDVKVSVYNDNTLNIDMGELPAGSYFLKMDDCCDRHITVKLSKL